MVLSIAPLSLLLLTFRFNLEYRWVATIDKLILLIFAYLLLCRHTFVNSLQSIQYQTLIIFLFPKPAFAALAKVSNLKRSRGF